jgi:uncharacterized protein (TIGR02444 family)
VKFWDWALLAYARPGAAEDCLELQDAYGQSVPYLLWAAWAAADGRRLAPERLARGAALARAWEDAAVGPLRQVRRRIKSPIVDLDEDAREQVRVKVKAVELAAERALIEALEGLAPPPGLEPLLLAAAVAEAGAAWRPAAPLDVLLSHIAQLV